MLIHAHLLAPYWAEALATVTYLLNRRPSSAIRNAIPYALLYNKITDYSHLRVFECLCYPNLTAMTRYKLASHSTACVFLGYPSSHKGYRYLDLSTRRIIISRHVVFYETYFPFGLYTSGSSPSDLDFLLAGSTVPTRLAAVLSHVAAVPPRPPRLSLRSPRTTLRSCFADLWWQPPLFSLWWLPPLLHQPGTST